MSTGTEYISPEKFVLTYRKGLFYFSGQLSLKVSSRHSLNWRMETPRLYATLDLGAAFEQRKYADEKVKKIFSRVLLHSYQLHPHLSLPDFLDEHQKEGVRWILSRSRSYLAHAPGAGKTAQAITAACLSWPTQVKSQTLFIVPPSLTLNWAREIEKFISLIHPTRKPRPFLTSVLPESSRQKEMDWEADFLIVPDSMITKDWVQNRLKKIYYHFLAVDEASRFKEASAQRTIALFGGTLNTGRIVKGLVRVPKHAVLLDGSPMPNRPMELWAPVFGMDPECIDFMSRENFGLYYCDAYQNNFGQWIFQGASHMEELTTRVRKNFMHVVNEAELTHPERKRSILLMNRDVRTLSQQRWQQKVASQLSQFTLSDDASQGQLATLRRELGLQKVSWITRYVEDRLRDKNESVMLFIWHREVGEKLESALLKYSPRLILGDTPAFFREKAIEDFQKGRTKLLIGNILTLGRGHNLQNADRVVFGEFSWCNETNVQAEKRVSRRGNDRQFVRCDYIVCPNSVDEMVVRTLFRKEKLTDQILKKEETFL